MSTDDSERRVLSRKELAKEQRREAYQKAKQQRASDPRHLALKEAAKAQRRAAYQKLKQGRAAETAAKKSKLSERRAEEHNEQHAATEARLTRLTQRASHTQSPWQSPTTETRVTSATQRALNSATDETRLTPATQRASRSAATETSTKAEQADKVAAEHAIALGAYVTWGKRSNVLN